ncbi:MAG: hypothetical protein Q9187_007594 [Circinaria calcarea]
MVEDVEDTTRIPSVIRPEAADEVGVMVQSTERMMTMGVSLHVQDMMEDAAVLATAGRGHPEAPQQVTLNCYELIRGTPTMDQDELNRAIRLARARVHPDKLKKPGMSAEEERRIDNASTAVAQAAEVLKDPIMDKIGTFEWR